MNRYKRITQLGWNRSTLANATIMVVGAGALGNEVLKNLALLGVGKILVIDMDNIEDHNLTRSVLFRAEDIGKNKAIVAAAAIRKMNPDVNILPFVGKVQDVFGLGIYTICDLVFGCLDNIQARMDVNRYCFQSQTPFIDAGLRHLDGDVKVFAAPYEVCLDCTLTQRLRDEAWRRFSCLKLRHHEEANNMPTAPTISSIMAGWQVQIGIKHLHGKPIPVNHRISIFGYIDDMNRSKLSRSQECPTHNLYDPIPMAKLVELPYTSDTFTWEAFLQIVQKDIGETASISLDFDLITQLTCTHHDYTRPMLHKRGSLFIDEVECAQCKAEGKTSINALMRERFTNQISTQTEAAVLAHTLQDTGIPLCQIFEVKAMKAGQMQYAYYEISGDKTRNLV